MKLAEAISQSLEDESTYVYMHDESLAELAIQTRFWRPFVAVKAKIPISDVLKKYMMIVSVNLNFNNFEISEDWYANVKLVDKVNYTENVMRFNVTDSMNHVTERLLAELYDVVYTENPNMGV